MAKAIDWLYSRKHCVTCQKAEACRTTLGITVREQADAKTLRIPPEAALELIEGIDTIVAMKGAKVDTLKLKDEPGEAAILALLIGPTGNLRAPTARIGKKLYVGFNESIYKDLFGK